MFSYYYFFFLHQTVILRMKKGYMYIYERILYIIIYIYIFIWRIFSREGMYVMRGQRTLSGAMCDFIFKTYAGFSWDLHLFWSRKYFANISRKNGL